MSTNLRLCDNESQTDIELAQRRELGAVARLPPAALQVLSQCGQRSILHARRQVTPGGGRREQPGRDVPRGEPKTPP